MNNSQEILSTLGDIEESPIDLSVIDFLPLEPKTKQGIFEVGTKFLGFLDRKKLELSIDSVVSFLSQHEDDVSGAEISPATRNLRKSLLKRLLLSQPYFCGHLDRQHLLEEAFKRVKSSVVDRKIKEEDYLTIEEMNDFWGSCNKSTQRKQKIYLLTKALFQSGCRINELLSVRLDNCTPNGHVAIHLHKTKRNKTRTVYIERELYEKIKVVFNGNKLLFESEQGNKISSNNVLVSIKRFATEAGIFKNIKNHTWRHSAAMYLLMPKSDGGKGLSIKQVSTYLGHSSSVTTIDYYIHDMPSASNILD